MSKENSVSSELSDNQRAILALWYEVNASLSAYDKLLSAFGSASQAWVAGVSAWRQLGLHHTHLKRHEASKQTIESVDKVQQAIYDKKYHVVFADQPEFPPQLLQIFDPPPLLFCRGNSARLQQAQIAIVGSRNPTPHAQKTTFDMAQYLAQTGYVITSGLAMGVDKRAHLGALTQANPEQQGRTIGVMGTGIDICYPTHHGQLFDQIVEQGGCLISELLPHTPPHRHTFPRRNRLVAGLSLATIVTEAALQSGSLITARLTSEQGKQVFAIPSHIDNHNAEGCHHLIREGATLIYHPDQVLDDVNMQLNIRALRVDNDENSSEISGNMATLTHKNRSKTVVRARETTHINLIKNESVSQNSQRMRQPTVVPEHLSAIYEQLDWHGQDLDTLIIASELSASQLIGQLMELELLGAISEQGGRYLRV